MVAASMAAPAQNRFFANDIIDYLLPGALSASNSLFEPLPALAAADETPRRAIAGQSPSTIDIVKKKQGRLASA
jgi:hypothetical protein